MSLKLLALTTGLVAGLSFSALPAGAEDKPMDMDMSMPMGDHSPSSHAFSEANNKMHKDMMIEYSGDADIDFVRGMIAHHQGAIDMAKVVLQHGKDAKTREWAEAIIANQQREIDEMNAWLKAHGR